MSKNKKEICFDNLPFKSKPCNVAVVGLPIDLNGMCYGAKPGKSFLCNRYIHPNEDDQHESHSSVFSRDCMKLSSVINNEQFLYWGNKTIHLYLNEEDTMNNVDQISLNVFEFTNLCESNLSNKIDVNKIYQNYHNLITHGMYCSPHKVAYICYDQAINCDQYKKHHLYTGYHENQFTIDCYIVVISVEVNIDFIQQQLTFLLDFYNRNKHKLIDNQVTIIVAANKCDSFEFTETLDVLKEFLKENQLDLPLIETSAFYNVNVAMSFSMVAYLHYCKMYINSAINKKLFIPQIKLFDAIKNNTLEDFLIPILCNRTTKEYGVSSKSYDIDEIYRQLPKLTTDSVYPFNVQFTKNCLLLNNLVQQFISLIGKYAENLAFDKCDLTKFCQFVYNDNNPNDMDIIRNCIDFFGHDKLNSIFTEVYIHKYTLIETWIRQKYMETFITMLETLFTDINSLSVCSWKWDNCHSYLETISNFDEYFVRNSEYTVWNSVERMKNYVYLYVLDNDTATRLFKFKIPFDFLDIEDCKIEFERYVQELAEKNNQEAVVNQLEEQLTKMILDGEFKASDAVEEVAFNLLFRGYDRLSQAIMEYEFTPIFTKYSDMLKDQAKRDFHELLFEKVIPIDNLLQGKFKMGTLRNIIKNDERFTRLDGRLSSSRDGWIINHLASRDRTDICVLNHVDESLCIRNRSEILKHTFTHLLVPYKNLPNLEFTPENTINLFLICSKDQFESFYNVVAKNFGRVGTNTTTQIDTFPFDHIMYWYEKAPDLDGDQINKFSSTDISFPFRLLWFESKWANLKHIEQKFIPISYTNLFLYFADDDNHSLLQNFINSFSNIITNDLDQKQLNLATKRIVNSVVVFTSQRAKLRNTDCKSLSTQHSLDSEEKSLAKKGRKNSVNKCDTDNSIVCPENSNYLSSIASTYRFKIEYIPSSPEKCANSIIYTMIRNADYITQYSLEVNLKINISVCMMCGDLYPIEMIVRMIIFNRKYYYFRENNTFRILYHSNITRSTYFIDVNFLPYHSSYKWSDIGGCISVCTTGRLSSIEAMRALMHRNLGLPTHIICLLAKLKKSPSGDDCNVCQQTQIASKSAIHLLSDEGLTPTLFDAFRKLNVFFEMCVENASHRSCSLSECISDANFVTENNSSNMDISSKENMHIKLSSNSRIRKSRMTITSGAIDCKTVLMPNSNVIWHKNPMYLSNSSNTISASVPKSRKWVTYKPKKGDKPMQNISQSDNPVDSNIIYTTVASTDRNNNNNQTVSANDTNNVCGGTVATTNPSLPYTVRTSQINREHRQPERYTKLMRHQPLYSRTSPRRSGSLLASDYANSTPDVKTFSRNQSNALCLDIISCGYLNTSSLASRTSAVQTEKESNTNIGVATSSIKKVNKYSEKGKFTYQFNKVFNTLKAISTKKTPIFHNNNQFSNESNENISNNINKNKNESVFDKIQQWNNIQARRDLAIYNKNNNNDNVLCTDSFIGKPLSEICGENFIPEFVIKVIQHIENSGLETEGLYRISGRKHNIDLLISNYHHDNNIDFSELDYNVHVYTSALKSFIKSLPTPLFPQNLFDVLLKNHQNPIAISSISDICSKLDDYSLSTFKILMKHLNNVAKYSTTNQMMPNNLSLCWWPTIVRPTVESITKLNQDGAVFTAFFTTIIDKYYEVFSK